MSASISSRSLIVSCQAEAGSPLDHPDTIARLAAAVAKGGARGVRIDGEANISAVRLSLPDLPVIGIRKIQTPEGTLITPTIEDAKIVAEAGCSMVAFDATERRLPAMTPVRELIELIGSELSLMSVADIDTVSAGAAACAAGADVVATTLAGYTDRRPLTDGPDLTLVSELAAEIDIPIYAEGRFSSAEEVQEAFERGAHAVVIGTAVTNPTELTRRLALHR